MDKDRKEIELLKSYLFNEQTKIRKLTAALKIRNKEVELLEERLKKYTRYLSRICVTTEEITDFIKEIINGRTN